MNKGKNKLKLFIKIALAIVILFGSIPIEAAFTADVETCY